MSIPGPEIDVRLATARDRALRKVREAVAQTTTQIVMVAPVIPVTRAGWETVLADAEISRTLHDFVNSLRRAREVDPNDRSVIGGVLRRMLMDSARLFEELFKGLEAASWFVPPNGQEQDREVLEQIRAMGTAAFDQLIEALTATVAATSGETWQDRVQRLAGLGMHLTERDDVASGDEDILSLLFGAPAEAFTDARGVIDSSRIRAAYAERPHELDQISRRLLTALIGDAGVPPPDASVYAAAFSLSGRPLICHEVARETVAEITQRFEVYPEATGGALARRFAGINNSASTHFDGIAPTLTRLEGAQRETERARLTLDLYRQIAEGPLRNIGWGVPGAKRTRPTKRP